MDLRGRGGVRLADKWNAGPRAYLGMTIAAFPNLFTVIGPGGPSAVTNVPPIIEQNVEWIARCLQHLTSEGKTSIEPTEESSLVIGLDVVKV